MLTKVQVAVIEECIRKAERGPAIPFIGGAAYGASAEAEASCKRWSETWIGHPLRMLLENNAGNVSESQLSNYEH